MAIFDTIDYSAPGEYRDPEEEQAQANPMAMLQQDPKFAAILQKMDPEQRSQFMRQVFQDYGGQEGIIGDEQFAAEEMQGTATPQGVQVGNQFVAANPLAHIATAGQRIMGNIAAKKALARKEALSKDRTGGVTSIADILRQRMNPEEDAKRELMEQEMRNNRRGGTPMELMAANQNKPGFA